jgi:hypothetical protein
MPAATKPNIDEALNNGAELVDPTGESRTQSGELKAHLAPKTPR